MQRAINLARNGAGHVSPNPMVGCVIVHQDEIIGEGWHRKYGEAHAEVNAINAVKNQDLLKESTIYVTLEPCSHFGKTPPCADLLVEKQVKRVIIATTDPNPKVAGNGIKRLTDADVEVQTGILQEDAVKLNRRFFTAFTKNRPYVILKWAQTKDGFIARKDFSSKWISNSYSRQLVHKWRAEEDAILVGSNTAVHDNPSLTVREWHGKDPLRIVIDRHLKLSQSLLLFTDGRKTICYNLLKSGQEGPVTYQQVEGATILQDILKDLSERGVQSLIVEGGAAVINAFIDEDLWDEARIFISKNTFKEGVAAPLVQGNLIEENFVGDNELLIYSNTTNEWLKH